MANRLNSEWFSGLNEEDKKEAFKRAILGATQVLDKACEILKKRREGLAWVTQQDYDNPSWSHKQADRNGALRELDFCIKLLTLTKE